MYSCYFSLMVMGTLGHQAFLGGEFSILLFYLLRFIPFLSPETQMSTVPLACTAKESPGTFLLPRGKLY